MPTVTTSKVPFITALTCPASTDKSGSATVISRPITKQTPSRMPSFRDLVRPSPIYCPIGVIAISAPRLNRLIPRMSRISAPANTASSWVEISTQGVTDRIKTSRLTGTTDAKASFNLSSKDFQRSRETGLLFSVIAISSYIRYPFMSSPRERASRICVEEMSTSGQSNRVMRYEGSSSSNSARKASLSKPRRG